MPDVCITVNMVYINTKLGQFGIFQKLVYIFGLWHIFGGGGGLGYVCCCNGDGPLFSAVRS